MVDTLAIARELKLSGMAAEQADAVASAIGRAQETQFGGLVRTLRLPAAYVLFETLLACPRPTNEFFASAELAERAGGLINSNMRIIRVYQQAQINNMKAEILKLIGWLLVLAQPILLILAAEPVTHIK